MMLTRLIPVMCALALICGELHARDLSGTWSCDDGGTYYLRQVDSRLYWYGEQSPTSPGWSNVLVGRVLNDRVTGEWADVPKGRASGRGSLVLAIGDNGNSMVAQQKTGGFGGSRWTRQGQPSPQASCSITGAVTGQKQFAKNVAVFGPNDRTKLFKQIPVSPAGDFRLSGLPPGSYRVVPSPGGKFDLRSSPKESIVECSGGENLSANFNILGIEEG